MRHTISLILLLVAASALQSLSARERELIDNGWQFALGNAASPASDFGCGTEYFNYLTKANSIHNEGPYSPKFDPVRWGVEWHEVNLPHDWVVDLPFAAEASHSHGYKTVGYRYPETSVGWYRRTFDIPQEDYGQHIWIEFDGIFRDARVWVNGFYVGHEPSGYATQVYDITEYVNYGGENLVCVRADATLEEGWFYEGAGIYRHVWLCKASRLHVAPFGTFAYSELSDDYNSATLHIEATVRNASVDTVSCTLRHTLLNAAGETVGKVSETALSTLLPMAEATTCSAIAVESPNLWSTESPYLYKIITEVLQGGTVVDTYTTTTGIRNVNFDPDSGFSLNGKPLKLKGVNMHQDHAGVGAAMPDALQVYRLKQLKAMGCNAYRASHNPMTPETLDACDSLGILVIEENRLTGVNEEHRRLLKRMIERDRNHPSIILWSVGNEEWGIEWDEKGVRIAATMREFCHRLDPTRKMTVATSGGPTIVIPADVAGYNYIMQNPVEQHRADYPRRCAVGSEETSGCGTRGIYFNDALCLAGDGRTGRMPALNRSPNGADSALNCIERGWKFYSQREWLGGLFYWTGFDYRGEPNPLEFPATGSQFGILDYCGFPKDEAYYLKAWWTDEPVLHILPHWNLSGHEGESVDIWVYSNCDEVELIVNGRKLGRKTMPQGGHLSWTAVYRPGTVKAIGYKNGKRQIVEQVETTGDAAGIVLSADRNNIAADGRDLAVVSVELQDGRGRFVPDACGELALTVDGPVRILGVGNGDPAWQVQERPADPASRTFSVEAFNGLAQVLLQSTGESGTATLTVAADGISAATISIEIGE